MPTVSVIVPVYNTSEFLERCCSSLKAQTFEDWEAIFVDDGSRDSTWECLRTLHARHPEVRALRLSHNSGQQAATLAGMETCVDEADAVISMDVDLQLSLIHI